MKKVDKIYIIKENVEIYIGKFKFVYNLVDEK